MLKLAVLAVLMMMVAAVVLTVIAVITMAALAVAILIPMYLISRRWLQGRAARPAERPVERLQSLYAEGKIDMFEFETRIADLVALGH